MSDLASHPVEPVAAVAVIGRVYRGKRVGGLIRYLYGPGRHNEHENPHVVASWEGSSAYALRTVEPAVDANGERDLDGLVADLMAPARYAERLEREPVWHCALRSAPGDRVLTDAEWAEVAEDLMHRTGLAPRGDAGACRWVAVRHDDVSIHVMAVLARQDGAGCRRSNDWLKVRSTCLAAERRLGLQVTAPADRTAARHTTRPEVEKAARHGRAVPDRQWLREQVQAAAAGTRDAETFFARLRDGGVLVRERRDDSGRVHGYAVARPLSSTDAGSASSEAGATAADDPATVGAPGDLAKEAAGSAAGADGDGGPVFFGGGKLAVDLSLPRLQARWALDAASRDAAPAPPAAAGAARPAQGGEPAVPDRGVRQQAARPPSVWRQAAEAVAQASGRFTQPNGDASSQLEDVPAALSDVLHAAARALGRPPARKGEGARPVVDSRLLAAARAYDRASRHGRGPTPAVSAAGAGLRTAAFALLAASSGPRRAEAVQIALLLRQLQLLTANVAELRRVQGRAAQAAAADRAATQLEAAARDWTAKATRPAVVVAATAGPAVTARPTARPTVRPTATSATPPTTRPTTVRPPVPGIDHEPREGGLGRGQH